MLTRRQVSGKFIAYIFESPERCFKKLKYFTNDVLGKFLNVNKVYESQARESKMIDSLSIVSSCHHDVEFVSSSHRLNVSRDMFHDLEFVPRDLR